MKALNSDRLIRETFLEHVIGVPKTDSTNTLALSQPCSKPTLFWTPNQIAGRGRGSNVWIGGPGCLTFTVTLPENDWPIPESIRPRVSLVAALAMADALDDFALISLKWPNDLYASDRKLAGILVEAHPDKGLVVGIGVNISNILHEVQTPAISLRAFGSEPEPEQILIPFLHILEPLLNRLMRDDLPLSRAWTGRCWLTGKTVQLDHGLSGICQGIRDDGSLRILKTDGEEAASYGGIVAISEQ